MFPHHGPLLRSQYAHGMGNKAHPRRMGRGEEGCALRYKRVRSKTTKEEVSMLLLRYKYQELDQLDDNTTVDELRIAKDILAAFLGCKACDIEVEYGGRVRGGRRLGAR